MNHQNIAQEIINLDEKIILIYAFNTTGKTRLSVAFKDETKSQNKDKQQGVYYNAFSEDLFRWDNDIDNNEENIKLFVNYSSLNNFHASLTEDIIREKLEPYKLNYDFDFNLYDDVEKGIESISFFILKKNEETKEDTRIDIKISRGEERIFVWCFYLALFSLEDWTKNQSEHFFIDDPVSSLDDHNIFTTAFTLIELFKNYSNEKKIIITTHHIGFFSILVNWLTKGEQSDKYKKISKLFILNKIGDKLSLENPKNNVFLYHLHLLKTLDKAINDNTLGAYHFVLLRQILENISSFLGVGRFSYVLDKIGFDDASEKAFDLNILSHKNIYTYESEIISDDNKNLIIDIFQALKNKYDFKL
jgi:hypothetical protein